MEKSKTVQQSISCFLKRQPARPKKITEAAPQAPDASRGLAMKEASNPFSTGGGGFSFEQRMQAFFVTLLLTDGTFPSINEHGCFKIALQGRNLGYQTDDMVLFFVNEEKIERKLLVQIKHKLTFTKGDKQTRDAFSQAWHDFNNKEVFSREADKILLITGMLSQDQVDHLKPMFDAARHSDNADHFVASFSHAKEKQKKLENIKEIVDEIAGKGVTTQEFWEFLKVLDILGYDIDSPNGKDANFILNLLEPSLVEPTKTSEVWALICQETSEYNKQAGIITKSNFLQTIKKHFKKTNVAIFTWRVPPFIPQNFVGNVAQLQTIKERLIGESVTMPIFGLGGIGKTYLALKIVNDLQHNYHCIVWFNAASVETIKEQFLEFAKEKRLVLDETTDKIEQIRTWFNTQTHTLLVFDNAENYSKLKQFLPNTGHIVITSINAIGWPRGVRVEPMETKDAVNLLKQEMANSNPASEEEVYLVENLLGNLPLAIAQAGAYINATGSTVADYIRYYKDAQARLLADGTLHETRGEHDPVYITFELSIDKIADDVGYARELINYCAYLGSYQRIPCGLIAQVTTIDAQLEYKNAIACIQRFSLIKADGGWLYIHCVVQDVIRSKLRIEGKYTEWLIKVMDALIDQFNYRRSDHGALEHVCVLVPHVLRIIEHATKTDLGTYATSLGQLLHKLGIYYLDYRHEPEEAIKHLKEAEKFVQGDALLQKNNRFLFKAYAKKGEEQLAEYYADKFDTKRLQEDELIDHLIDLGNYYLHRKQKDLDKAEACFLDALKYVEKDLEKKTMVYHYLGTMYRFQGEKAINTANLGKEKKWGEKWIRERMQEAQDKFQKSLQYYKEALKYKKAYYADNNPEIARTLHQMGVTYCKLEDYRQASDCFAEALKRFNSFYNQGPKSEITTVSYDLAEVLFLRIGKLDEAKRLFNECLTQLEKLPQTPSNFKLMEKSRSKLAELSASEKSRIERYFKPMHARPSEQQEISDMELEEVKKRPSVTIQARAEASMAGSPTHEEVRVLKRQRISKIDDVTMDEAVEDATQMPSDRIHMAGTPPMLNVFPSQQQPYLQQEQSEIVGEIVKSTALLHK